MKQLPERYAKIWQYMVDSNQPINDNRIEGMLTEIFMSRLGDTKDMVKNNIKTMKIREKFDLRSDHWMQSIVDRWSQVSLPEFVEQVKDIKRTPDIKDRSPKMRTFMSHASAGMSPMSMVNFMEEEYRRGKEALVEPELEPLPGEESFNEQDYPEDEPGFLRRAVRGVGGYAGGLAKAAGSAAAGGLLMHRGMIGTLARGAAGMYGLHKAARNIMKSKASSSASGRSTSIKSLFGAAKSPFRVKPNTDFTPREESLEGDEPVSILKRIEENTAALLDKFGGVGMGDKKGGSGIMNMFGGFAKSLLSFLKGPAMLAAVAALGVTLAAAFGKEAADYLCKKFDWLCGGGMDENEDDKFAATQRESMAKWEADAREAIKNGTATEYQKKIIKERDDFAKTPLSKMRAGDLVRKLETGSAEGNYGAVNPNDKGLPSYGAYQFRHKEGNLPEYLDSIKSNDRYKPIAEKLEGKTPGTREFDEAWTELAADPETKELFKESQDKSFEKVYHKPAIKALRDITGFHSNSILLQETAAQLFVVAGAGGGRRILAAVRNKHGTKKLSEMTEKEQAQAIADQMEGKVDANRISSLKSFIQSADTSSVPQMGFSGNPVPPESLTGTDAHDYEADRQVQAILNAKKPAPKAPGITPAAPGAAGQSGNTTVNVVAPKSEQAAQPAKQRPYLRPTEESLDKRLLETKRFSTAN